MFQFSGFAPRQSGVIPLQGIGLPHSEIFGYNGYLHLAEAYRSLSRPSSPLRAKASTIRSCLLFSVMLDFVLSLYFQYVKEPIVSAEASTWADYRFCIKLHYIRTHPTFSASWQIRWAIVENIGVEPMTSCVQGRRSSQLS
jgi:hypothetical protein